MVRDTAYRANDAIEVRIRDLSRVGAALDTIMGRGMTDISPIPVHGDRHLECTDIALREATIRARAQAETMADASGLQLGRVLSLSTDLGYVGYGEYSPILLRGATATALAGGEGSPGTVVVSPSIPVSVTVHGRWELLPKR